MANENTTHDSTPGQSDHDLMETGAAATTETTSGNGAELHALLAAAQAKADEHWDQLLRTRAELDNLRRRAQRDVESAHKYAVERLVQELLPVWDSLRLGAEAARAENADVARLREGTELTLKMLQAAMEKSGVREVDPQGQPFNPELHQAMTTQETSEQAPNTVLRVYQKGYVLNDRLVRPAMVVVAKAAAGSVPPESRHVDERA